MKILLASILSLCLSVPPGQPVIIDGGDGPSASGTFKLSLENGVIRDIRFNAKSASDGSTTGEITFQDGRAAATEPQKATGDSEESESTVPFYAKATCDCLVVKGVEAVLSGVVTESSRPTFVGRRVLVVVQDGDSLTPPLRDKLTFGFYRNTTGGWVETDGERPDEQGPAPSWVATDAERPDEAGTINHKSQQVTCERFPMSSHNFISTSQGKGKIQVTR